MVVPVLNEGGERLVHCLQNLSDSLSIHHDGTCEIVVVDGGSCDDTWTHLQQWATDKTDNNCCSIHIFQAEKGRARQMNAGAGRVVARDSTHLIWFLHADSIVDERHFAHLRDLPTEIEWGRFNVRLDNDAWLCRIIETLINVRSKVTQVMTGDQGIYVRQSVFKRMEGYADIPLMEDIEISKRLRMLSRADCTGPRLGTSARRWLENGFFKTIVLMWWLRLRYWAGASPQKLVKIYYGDTF